MDKIHGVRGILNDGSLFESIGDMWLLHFTASSDSNSSFEGLLMLSQIEIKSVPLDGASGPAMLKFPLTNLRFIGTEFCQQTPNHATRRLPLEINGYKVALYREDNYKELIDEMEATKSCKVTSYFIIPYTENSLGTYHELVRHLCALLSFAKGTEINWPYYQELDKNGKIIKSIHRCSITSDYGSTEIIDSHEPNDLKNFLETVFETYLQRKNDYELEQIIHAIVQSKLDGSFLELRALIVSSAIDVLRGKWSKLHGREKIFGNRFRKCHKNLVNILTIFAKDCLKAKGDQIEYLLNKIPELNRPSLRDILAEMASDVKACVFG